MTRHDFPKTRDFHPDDKLQPARDSEISRILEDIRAGSEDARDRLFDAVYERLHRMAWRCLSPNQRNETLQASALVNEMYLKLFGRDPKRTFVGRSHFFATAAAAMRSILVDYVRRKSNGKRSTQGPRVPLDVLHEDFERHGLDVIVIDDVLKTVLDEESARVVDLRLFYRHSTSEVAQLLGLSPRTVERRWTHAKEELAIHFSR